MADGAINTESKPLTLKMAAAAVFCIVAAIAMIMTGGWVLNKTDVSSFLFYQLSVAIQLFLAACIIGILRLPIMTAVKLLEGPAQKNTPDVLSDESSAIVKRILNGECHTSRATSQHAQGGNLACGLTSLNAVRLAFELCLNTPDGEALISALISEPYVNNAMEIARFWSKDIHLETKSILELPLFKRSLQVTDVLYRVVQFELFSDILRILQSGDSPRAAVLTRAPEMIAVMHIPVRSSGLRSFYLIFDSHPRPNHPHGAAVNIFPYSSADLVANYLLNLFQIDEGLMNDPMLQWQAQLLAQISCCFLAPIDIHESSSEYETNMMFLRLTQRLSEAEKKIEVEAKGNRDLRDEISRLQQQVTSVSANRHKERETRRLGAWSNEGFSPWYTRDLDWQKTYIGKSSPKGKGKEGASKTNWHRAINERPGGLSRAYPDMHKLAVSSRAHTLPVPNGSSGSRSSGLAVEDPGLIRSLEVAMAMQQAFDNEHVTMLQDESLVQTLERPKFECLICMESLTNKAIAVADGCSHLCCRDCMRGHVRSKIEERRYPILCPFCAVRSEDKLQPKARTGVISLVIVETLGVTPEEYNIYVELQLAEHSVMLDCRRCLQSAFVDREDYDLADIVPCPLPGCTNSWCKQCNQGVEEGLEHSCDGSAELESLMQRRGWKHCPGCRTAIERSVGCNHMTCSTPGCNMHFCYVCGGNVIRGGTRNEIRVAVSAHFRRCALFDVPRGV